MSTVRLHDKEFEPWLDPDAIDRIVTDLAGRLRPIFIDKRPVLLIVLKGAFIFAADLVRKLDFPVEIDFVKVSSYEGTDSSGRIEEQLHWHVPLSGRHVLVVEDIVDQGHTLDYLRREIRAEAPASVAVACLLFKPEAYHYQEPVEYPGLGIPNDFVVGYGLDYDQEGRGLPALYRVKA